MPPRRQQRIPTWAVLLVLLAGGISWYQLMQRYGQSQPMEWKIPENKPVWDQVAEIQLDEARYGKLPDPKSLDPHATGWTEDLPTMPESEARARIQVYHQNLKRLHTARRKVLKAMRRRNEEPTITDPLDLMTSDEYERFLRQAQEDLVADLRPLWRSMDAGVVLDATRHDREAKPSKSAEAPHRERRSSEELDPQTLDGGTIRD